MSELEHTMVSIRFVGKDLEPKVIGELLGLIESESIKTIIKKLQNGKIVWSIELVNDRESTLEEKIKGLLEEFTKDICVWRQVTEKIKADIFCGLFLDEWNQGFIFTSNLMKELSDRNLEIGFDVYSPTDSWDD